MTVSYHTKIIVELEKKRVTRGDTWNFSGRLFENDTGFSYGLENRQIIVMMDEEIVGETTTQEGGLFTYNQSVSYYISRGIHNLSFTYGGEFLYLPTNANASPIALPLAIWSPCRLRRQSFLFWGRIFSGFEGNYHIWSWSIK